MNAGWETMAMVISVAALAAGSITEVVKKAIPQGVIERTGDKPWWRGTVLRLCSVMAGALFGWMMMPEQERLGLILGIGSGSVTSEAIGMAKRVTTGTDFAQGGETEFERPALTEEDLKR